MRIVVHGAGIFGLSIAWTCARRGAEVIVVDPGGIGAGASGGLVGALAPHVPETWNTKKALQYESLVMAEAFWAEVAETGGRDPGYRRGGRVQPLDDDAAVARARARANGAAEFWQGRYAWEVVTVAQAGIDVESATGLVLRDGLSARLHPRQACAALAAAIEAEGGVLLSEAPRDGLHVHATGVSGLAALNALSKTRIIGSAVKGQAALLAADLRDAPQVYADGLHIVPHGDGTTAIGSTSEREFDDPESTDAQLDKVIERARGLCPALRDAPVIERWAGLRPRVRSRAPMLGPHPAIPGAFIANGGFKIGFGMAPIVARMMADLLIDGRDTIPAEFRPEASVG